MVICVGFGCWVFGCAPAPHIQPNSPAERQAGQRDDADVESIGSAAAERGSEDSTSTATPDTQADNRASATAGSSEMDTAAAEAALRHKATPIDVMTRGGTAYLVDFANFGANEAANATCVEKGKKVEAAAWAELAEKAAKEVREGKTRPSAQAKAEPPAQATSEDEPKKAKSPAADEEDEALKLAEAQEAEIAEKAEAARLQCIKEARERFEADVIRFRRDGLGHIKLMIYRRSGESLKELYSANVELDDSQAHKVKVVVKEPGSGKRPIMKDRSKFELLLPNDYSVQLEDPQYGKLSYTAKVGLVGN